MKSITKLAYVLIGKEWLKDLYAYLLEKQLTMPFFRDLFEEMLTFLINTSRIGGYKKLVIFEVIEYCACKTLRYPKTQRINRN